MAFASVRSARFCGLLTVGVLVGGGLLFTPPASAYVNGRIEQIDTGSAHDQVAAINRGGGMIVSARDFSSSGASVLTLSLVLPGSTEPIQLAQYEGHVSLLDLSFNDRNDTVWKILDSDQQPATRGIYLAASNGTELVPLSSTMGANFALNNQGYVAWSESSNNETFVRLYHPDDGSVSTLATSGPFGEIPLDMSDNNEVIWSQRRDDGIAPYQDHDLHIYSIDSGESTTISARTVSNQFLSGNPHSVQLIDPVINNAGVAVWRTSYVEREFEPVDLKFFGIHSYSLVTQEMARVSYGEPAYPEELMINLQGDVAWVQRDWDGQYVPGDQVPDHLLDREVHVYVQGREEDLALKLSDNHADADDRYIDLNDRGDLVWWMRDPIASLWRNMYFSAELYREDPILQTFVIDESDLLILAPKTNALGWITWSADDGNDQEIYLLEDALGFEPIQQITDHQPWEDVYDDRGVLISDEGYLAWTGSMAGSADAFRFGPHPPDDTPPVLYLPEDIHRIASGDAWGDCSQINPNYIGAHDGCDCAPNGSFDCDPDCISDGNPIPHRWCGCQYCYDATDVSAVYYSASAIDDVDGSVGVWCSPHSGSNFGIGQTTVECDAADSAGNEAFGSFSVFVEMQNQEPLVESFEVVEVPTALGDPVTAIATFCDPDTSSGQEHVAEIDWGDGGAVSVVNGSVSLGATETCADLRQITADYVYASTGVYTVTVAITDADAAYDTAEFQYAVIFDASDAFVTGGGWIDLPPGAYKPDPSLAGKANFGFVSKYKKGASVPTGNTEFQFKVADLDFKSTSYGWLVINGTNARFLGEGTINGDGSHRFILIANDAEPDTFRIRIWTEVEETGEDVVIFDSDLDQALGGGSIVIHEAR